MVHGSGQIHSSFCTDVPGVSSVASFFEYNKGHLELGEKREAIWVPSCQVLLEPPDSRIQLGVQWEGLPHHWKNSQVPTIVIPSQSVRHAKWSKLTSSETVTNHCLDSHSQECSKAQINIFLLIEERRQ